MHLLEERYEEGLRRAREARRCYGTRHPHEVRELYYQEGEALHQADRLEEAVRRFDALLEVRPPDSTQFYRAYRYRGFVEYMRGRLRQAVNDHLSAYRYAAGAPLFYRVRLARDIAAVFKRMRDFQSASRYYEEARDLLARADTSIAEVRFLRSYILRSEADLLLETASPSDTSVSSRAHRALRLIQESQRLNEGMSIPGEQVIFTHNLLGIAFYFLRRYEASRAHHEHSLQLARQQADEGWMFTALHSLGWTNLAEGRLDHAEEALLGAQALADETLHADYRRRLFIAFGHLYELKSEPARAEAYYRQAIIITEAYRAPLRATEWSAQAVDAWREPYRGLVRALLAQERPAEAFHALEQSRARHLQDLQMQARLLHTLPEPKRDRFDSLTAALDTVRNRLATRAPGAAEQRELARREAQLVADRRALLDLDAPATPPPLAAVQEALTRRDRVLLSYFIDDWDPRYERPPRSHAFVLTKDSLHAVPLAADLDSLERLLADVSPLLTASRGETDDLNATQFSTTALHALYTVLFAPVAPHVPEAAPLVIIPDASLFRLPFGALLEAETPPYQYHEAPYLIRSHAISTELATALLLDAPDPPSGFPLDVAAFGKTRFAAVEQSAAFRASSFAAASLPPLPAVSEEVEHLRRLFDRSYIALGEEATEGAFFRRMREAKVLHIASHAFASATSPLQNAFVLGAGNSQEAPRHDGLVHLYELPPSLSTELVTLSGCSTARGDLTFGEGLQGLQYGFRTMGVRSTLATRWLVEDQAIGALMKTFYRHLRDGAPKDVALQQAKLAFLEQADEALLSPFFWAAPTLSGDTAPLDLEPRQTLWPYGLLGAALALLLCIAFFVRRRVRS